MASSSDARPLRVERSARRATKAAPSSPHDSPNRPPIASAGSTSCDTTTERDARAAGDRDARVAAAASRATTTTSYDDDARTKKKSSSSSSSPPLPRAMRDLPRLYDVADARRIGKGGYASVFEGARRADGVAVAVKRVDTTGHSAKKRERCARELNLCASLPRHDNVVFLLDAFASEDALVMIFPLARGGDLRGAIRRRRRARERFRARDVWTIFRGVARGLAHLHARGIAHRDVKPANVLLGDCDSSSSSSSFADVKLADLGLAVRVPDADDARPLRSKVGTPFYLAPEVVRGGGYGLAADVWSLGCLLYELASSRSPFDEKSVDGSRGRENDARRSNGANGDVTTTKERMRKKKKKKTAAATAPSVKDVFRAVAEGAYAPLEPETHGEKLASLANAMLDLDAARRPSAREALRRAEDALRELEKEEKAAKAAPPETARGETRRPSPRSGRWLVDKHPAAV